MRTFIVVGPVRKPVLRTLTPSRFQLWVDRHCLGGGAAAASATFGAGFEVAIPAWDKETLMPIAQSYGGAFEVEVRGLAACIVLGLDPDRELPVLKTVKPKSADGGLCVESAQPQPVMPPQGARN